MEKIYFQAKNEEKNDGWVWVKFDTVSYKNCVVLKIFSLLSPGQML